MEPETDVASAPAPSSETASSTNNWKCPSCGAENEDFRKFCDGCGDKRPGATVASKGIAIEELMDSGSTSPRSDFEDEDRGKKGKKEKKGKKSKKVEEDEESDEPSRLEPANAASQWFDTGKDQPADDFESKPSLQPKDDSDSKPSFVVSGPEPTPQNDTFTVPSAPMTSAESSPSEPSPSGQHYYLVFVNTPASSLIKTRVMMEFDDFPTVTIGRSPENVVVIPDPEVSRKHASLSFNGSSLVLKDLGSSNGTFVYNGKEFERVSGSAEVRPNTVLKFGTGTIVKLVSE